MLSLWVVVGWLLGIALWYLGVNKPGLMAILIVVSYSTLGNFAAFFEVSAASRLDGSGNRVRLLPFLLLGFLVSLWSVSRATLAHLFWPCNGRQRLRWHKTEHNNHSPEHLDGANGGNGSDSLGGRNGHAGYKNGAGRDGRDGRSGYKGRNGHDGRSGRYGYSESIGRGGSNGHSADRNISGLNGPSARNAEDDRYEEGR
jgi:hypothetical protein